MQISPISLSLSVELRESELELELLLLELLSSVDMGSIGTYASDLHLAIRSL